MEASKEIKPTEQAELASSSQPLDNNEKGETDENVLERHSSAALSEEPEYPGSAQVAVIMACILSAIFLMSLVRLQSLPLQILESANPFNRVNAHRGN